MAFSQYFAEKILAWVTGTTFPTGLTSIHVTLHTADPGVAGTVADVTHAVCGVHSQSVSSHGANSKLSASGAAAGGGFEIINTDVVQMAATAFNTSPVTITHFGFWNLPCTSPHGTSNPPEEFIASGALTTSVEIQLNDTVQFNTGAMSIKVI